MVREMEINDSIQSIWLDLDKVFNISVTSSTLNKVIIKAKSEGEYANHFVIHTSEKNNHLHIIGAIGFTFPNNQDKLSAHKVHAIDVEITLPNQLFCTIISDVGNLKLSGTFKKLVFASESGNVKLNKPSGDFQVETIKGDIVGELSKGLVNAKSKNGEINMDDIPFGVSTYNLKTLKGNIKITKAQ